MHGAVDSETTDIVAADLDAKLAVHDEQLAKLRLPTEQRRVLTQLCQSIGLVVRGGASRIGGTVSEQDIRRYVDTALNFAHIKHPSLAKRRNRFASLVFPKD
jgi:hypothetical protein